MRIDKTEEGTDEIMLSISDIANILELLGSRHDPIIRHGIETTPDDLEYSEEVILHAPDPRRFWIQFCRLGSGRMTRGTLMSMLLDRLGINLPRGPAPKRKGAKR